MKRSAPDNWTECNGTTVPVEPETVVDVKFRDKVVWRGMAAGWFDEGVSNWVHDGSHCDITHFQVAA